jgi:hypothetical protein
MDADSLIQRNHELIAEAAKTRLTSKEAIASIQYARRHADIVRETSLAMLEQSRTIRGLPPDCGMKHLSRARQKA